MWCSDYLILLNSSIFAVRVPYWLCHCWAPCSSCKLKSPIVWPLKKHKWVSNARSFGADVSLDVCLHLVYRSSTVHSKGWGYCFVFLDLLSHLLIKAFENYDMENMITAFLIARQAALEGPAVFMPYSEWFKVRLNKTWLLIFKYVRNLCIRNAFLHTHTQINKKPGFRLDHQEFKAKTNRNKNPTK